MIERQGLTLVGVAVANLDDADTVQLGLPFDAHGAALDAALDEVRDRFGTARSRGPCCSAATGLLGAAAPGLMSPDEFRRSIPS